MANPDRLALFLVATPDEAVGAALEDALRRLGFDVRRSAGDDSVASPGAPSVELDYENATFAIFNLVGEPPAGAKAPPAEDDGHRVPPPGAYAVIMTGVGERESPEGVGTIEIDARGGWLPTVVRWLFEMGWTA